MGHTPGYLRETLCESFEGTEEWYTRFNSAEEALKLLGKLWNCTDAVPRYERNEAAEWLAPYLTNARYNRLKQGCTYAELSRLLSRALREGVCATV